MLQEDRTPDTLVNFQRGKQRNDPRHGPCSSSTTGSLVNQTLLLPHRRRLPTPLPQLSGIDTV